MNQMLNRDEIDTVVERLLAQPELAREIQERLNMEPARKDTAAQRRARMRLLTLCGDAESFWDNVPV
ncbi:MAG: hypothetical protein R3E44_11635 [Paracoccaceae bacterium]